MAASKKKNNTKVHLSDYYALPAPKWHVVPFEDSNNVTPPEALWEVARRHKNRENDLYILSQLNCAELMTHTDIPMPSYNKRELLQANPFTSATFLCATETQQAEMNLGRSLSTEKRVEKKLQWMLSLLRNIANTRHTCKAPKRECEQVSKIYDQIFLYYTQSEYKGRIKAVLDNHQDSLSARRMAIISSYIAQVQR